MVLCDDIQRTGAVVIEEILAVAHLKRNSIMVLGCSTSEIGGSAIGSASNMELAEAVLRGVLPALEESGIYLAVQCCEHLNRALVIEKKAAVHFGLQQVNAVPVPHAGGSCATSFYRFLEMQGRDPFVIEHICADAGLDIGQTLIGMHLRDVAVPVRLSVTHIGHAVLTAARTRLKYIGGSRTNYDSSL